MAKPYRLLRQARADMTQIVHYISDENPAAARKVKAAIMAACVRLGQNPLIGQQRGDLTELPVRFWPALPNYMIIYDATANPVRILRVYNTARHIASILPE